MITVTFHRTYFLEDEISDGEYGPTETETADYAADDIAEAARWIAEEGLTFAATGTDWAGDPDRSQIVNYETGRRVEVSAHLNDATPAQVAAIAELVG